MLILNGFKSKIGGDKSFSPYFTINLDYLFEKYCAFEIGKLMANKSCQVLIQQSNNHNFIPGLDAKKICPDIIVKSTQEVDSRCIIVDTKNKFSLSTEDNTSISNSDIFQIFYYAMAFKSNIGILLYPGDNRTATTYPIMGSEGLNSYKIKRNNKINEMLQSGKDIFCMNNGAHVFYLVTWRINLSDTLKDTRQSIAELCQFIADAATNKIL